MTERQLHYRTLQAAKSRHAVQNLAYLVELGGKKILHLGDADLTSQNFSPFDFPGDGIDVVIVPAETPGQGQVTIGQEAGA